MTNEPQSQTPFELLGSEKITQIAIRFYEIMSEEEPKLAALHNIDEEGKVNKKLQKRFALFLIGWLGGPQIYIEQHGHPRLRIRHQTVRIDKSMRDAWLRCMASSLDHANLTHSLRGYLDERFYVMANHLINV